MASRAAGNITQRHLSPDTGREQVRSRSFQTVSRRISELLYRHVVISRRNELQKDPKYDRKRGIKDIKSHSCEDRGHRVCHGLQNTQTKSKSKISNNFMNDLFLKRTTPQRNPSSSPHPSPTPQIKDYISILSSSLNGSLWVHFSTRQTCQQHPSPSSV